MSAVIAETTRLISRHNHAVARSAGMVLTGDGMVAAYRPRPGLAFLACLLVAVLALTLGKAILLSGMGAEAYDAALTAMQNGVFFDRVGSLFLGIDGVTAALGALMG